MHELLAHKIISEKERERAHVSPPPWATRAEPQPDSITLDLVLPHPLHRCHWRMRPGKDREALGGSGVLLSCCAYGGGTGSTSHLSSRAGLVGLWHGEISDEFRPGR
jgi:hypothetical protein